jgi:hypothetical protein
VCGDPGHQLPDAERLDHVVVGALLETFHAILLAPLRREDQDRRLHLLVAQAGEDLQARHPRQHEIEDDEIEGALARQPVGIAPVGGHVHDIAVEQERIAHTPRDRGLIFDHQDPLLHG